MFSSKVFVTGIYGSGKTTFVSNYRHLMPNHTFLSFDSLYKYDKCDTRIRDIYSKLRSLESFVMDALPLNNLEVDWPEFEKYAKTENCSIVLVKCEIDHWFKHHLVKKPFFLGATEAQHKQWFYEFYNGLGAKVLKTFPDKVWEYDSLSNTLSEPKSNI